MAMPASMMRVAAQLGARAFCEILGALVVAPFKSYAEVPQVVVSPQASEKIKAIVKKCPSLACFSPCPWAPGSYSQMIASKVLYSAMSGCKPWWREVVTLSDGVKVALDWKYDNSMDANAPIVMLSHGLGGDSSSHYIKGMSEACVRRGWRVVCYNRRGHAGMSILPDKNVATKKHKLFPQHADIDDMHEVSIWIRRKFPKAPMFIVGYSAGSNVVVKYLATHKDVQPFAAAISVNNAHDLDAATCYMKARRPLANALLAEFLREKIIDQEDKIHVLCKKKGLPVNIKLLKETTCFRELEAALLPMYGYKNLQQYYSEMSCVNVMRDINIPLLCLGSLDDLVVCPTDLIRHPEKVAQENENVISVVTQRGGHLGWLQGWRASSWLHQTCQEFISCCLETLET